MEKVPTEWNPKNIGINMELFHANHALIQPKLVVVSVFLSEFESFQRVY